MGRRVLTIRNGLAAATVAGGIVTLAPSAWASQSSTRNPVTLGMTIKQVKAEIGLYDRSVAWAPQTLAGMPGFLGTNASVHAEYAVAGFKGQAVEIGLIFSLSSSAAARQDGRVLDMLAMNTIGTAGFNWIVSHRAAFNGHRAFKGDVVRLRYSMVNGTPTLAVFIQSKVAYGIIGNAGGIG